MCGYGELFLAVYEGNTLIGHRLEPGRTTSTRIVYGFFEGRFNIAEMIDFFYALADSVGVAPKAEDFFRHSDDGLTIHTGGLIFDRGDVPTSILEFTNEFHYSRLLDEPTFRRVKQEWYDALRSVSATRLF